jgi:AIPR protein
VQTWEAALNSRDDLEPYGDNAIGLFALALRFNIEDLDSVAADAITDGADDKKCDILFVDREERSAVIAQCYFSKSAKPSAPANKACDLNTAVAWLLQSPIDSVPLKLRSEAKELRDAISTNSIDTLHIWYVHNLPESKNVKRELDVVEAAASTALRAHFTSSNVHVSSCEVGFTLLTEWYSDSLSPILVSDDFEVDVPSGFPMTSDDWEAFVTAVPAEFLHKLYRKYKTKLFSANVRDYLGSRKSDLNINYGIKQTADSDPKNFWVFNNGLTLLVNDFTIQQRKSKSRLSFKGVSIVNGAQTTGAIGSLKKVPSATAFVPVRFIKTANSEVVHQIIRYNNSQNKVTAPDFRSTDRIQKRLKDEMGKIPKAEYEGGRRGGHEDAIRRRANLLPSYTVGQALAAFHGEPIVAYHQKSDIWILDNLYAKYFNDDTAAVHIVFAYSLLRAVEARKLELVQKAKVRSASLTNLEEKQLAFFRNRGSIYLYVSAVAACMETFLSRKVPNRFKLSFGSGASPAHAQSLWTEIVTKTAPLCGHLEEAVSDGLKNSERVRKAIETFQGLVEVTSEANEKQYHDFASKVRVR